MKDVVGTRASLGGNQPPRALKTPLAVSRPPLLCQQHLPRRRPTLAVPMCGQRARARIPTSHSRPAYPSSAPSCPAHAPSALNRLYDSSRAHTLLALYGHIAYYYLFVHGHPTARRPAAHGSKSIPHWGPSGWILGGDWGNITHRT